METEAIRPRENDIETVSQGNAGSEEVSFGDLIRELLDNSGTDFVGSAGMALADQIAENTALELDELEVQATEDELQLDNANRDQTEKDLAEKDLKKDDGEEQSSHLADQGALKGKEAAQEVKDKEVRNAEHLPKNASAAEEQIGEAVKQTTKKLEQTPNALVDELTAKPELKTPTGKTNELLAELSGRDAHKGAIALSVQSNRELGNDNLHAQFSRNIQQFTINQFKGTGSQDSGAGKQAGPDGKPAQLALDKGEKAASTEPKNSTAETKQLAQGRQTEILERIQRVVTAASQSQHNNTIVVRLDPPALGAVTVKLIHRGDELFARIAPENPDVENVLRGRAQEISNALAASGIKVDNIHVSVGEERNPQEFFQFQEELNRKHRGSQHGEQEQSGSPLSGGESETLHQGADQVGWVA